MPPVPPSSAAYASKAVGNHCIVQVLIILRKRFHFNSLHFWYQQMADTRAYSCITTSAIATNKIQWQ